MTHKAARNWAAFLHLTPAPDRSVARTVLLEYGKDAPPAGTPVTRSSCTASCLEGGGTQGGIPWCRRCRASQPAGIPRPLRRLASEKDCP